MFLLERIVGFGSFTLILVLVCMFLAKTNVSNKLILNLYLVCLCAMAFLYKPYVTGDLYKIYEQMDFFATMDFKIFWRDFVVDSSMPMARMLFWSIGKIGVNELLPTLSAFICYSILFYIINKTQEMYDISGHNVAYALFFVMTTSIYISVIGGIRMMLAMSMILLCYFRGSVEHKRGLLDIILYAVSIFIHAMSLVVIAVCILVSLFDSERSAARKAGYVVVALFAAVVFAFNFTDTLRGLYTKALEYVMGDRYSDSWEYIMGALIMVLLVVLFVEFRRSCDEEERLPIKKYNAAAVWCVAIAACFFYEFSIFYRFGGQLAVLFALPSLMLTLERTEGKESAVIKGIDFRSILMLTSWVVAAVSCTRGSLSSLKFFEL